MQICTILLLSLCRLSLCHSAIVVIHILTNQNGREAKARQAWYGAWGWGLEKLKSAGDGFQNYWERFPYMRCD